jgi:hypothetical protein
MMAFLVYGCLGREKSDHHQISASDTSFEWRGSRRDDTFKRGYGMLKDKSVSGIIVTVRLFDIRKSCLANSKLKLEEVDMYNLPISRDLFYKAEVVRVIDGFLRCRVLKDRYGYWD